jgi:MoaA/NifB/PqqE/SkfB family radical SAM enzyme
MIERDYEFYANLTYHKNSFGFTGKNIMTEVTDKCNANCPHCYHIPNSNTDPEFEQITKRIHEWCNDDTTIILAGAEPVLRQDITELISYIHQAFPKSNLATLTNGIRFSDRKLVDKVMNAGLKGVLIGLNHPSYLNNPKVRKKQLEGIANCFEQGLPLYYIGYTMSSPNELFDILDEIVNSSWTPKHFRIRYGSDIGRYPNQERLYVSDTYKLIKEWCNTNGREFNDESGDNNLYHTMVNVDGKSIRVIQWCDETDIEMEELRTGPYCDFVYDGVTNFLHQIIRRDIYKNRKIMLPDSVPERYLMQNANKDIPIPYE